MARGHLECILHNKRFFKTAGKNKNILGKLIANKNERIFSVFSYQFSPLFCSPTENSKNNFQRVFAGMPCSTILVCRKEQKVLNLQDVETFSFILEKYFQKISLLPCFRFLTSRKGQKDKIIQLSVFKLVILCH